MKCTKCGMEFDSKFCPKCGAPAPQKNLCPKCNTVTDAEFCPNCGTQIAASVQATAKAGKKYTLFTSLSLVFAMLTFFILLIFAFGENNAVFDTVSILSGIAAPFAILPIFNYTLVGKNRAVSIAFSVLSMLSVAFLSFLSIKLVVGLFTALLSIIFSILAIVNSKNLTASISKTRNVFGIILVILLLAQIPFGFLDNKARKDSYLKKYGYIDCDRIVYMQLHDTFNLNEFTDDYQEYVPTEEELKASEELGLTSNTTIYRKDDSLDSGATRSQQFDVNKNNDVDGYAVHYTIPVGDPFVFTVLEQLNTYYNDNFGEDVVFKDTVCGKKYTASELSSLKNADHLISAYIFDDDLSMGTYVSFIDNAVCISIMYSVK